MKLGIINKPVDSIIGREAWNGKRGKPARGLFILGIIIGEIVGFIVANLLHVSKSGEDEDESHEKTKKMVNKNGLN